MTSTDMAYGLVMLVDDGELDNFLHRKVIERAHFAKKIVVANSGREALEYLETNENLEGGLPNLIFLDINMPGMDGFHFLDAFKDLSTSIRDTCKIMILSSSINQGEIERITKDKHVLKFIDKPLRAYDLAKIRSILPGASN